MGIHKAGAVALHLSLVLLSLLAAAGHDHLGERDHGARACVVDHDAEHGVDRPSSMPWLGHAAKLHEHECAGCRLGSQRPSLDTPRATGCPPLELRFAGVDEASRRAFLQPSSRTSRGPPAS